MIITVILNFIFLFVTSVLNLLPVASLPSFIISSVQSLWNYGNLFSYVFPVQALLQVIGILVLYELAWFIYWVFVIIRSFFPR